LNTFGIPFPKEEQFVRRGPSIIWVSSPATAQRPRDTLFQGNGGGYLHNEGGAYRHGGVYPPLAIPMSSTEATDMATMVVVDTVGDLRRATEAVWE